MVKSLTLPGDEDQTAIFQGLIDQMHEQGHLINVPQVPGQVDMSGTTPPAAATTPKIQGAGTIGDMAVPGAAATKTMQTTNQSVTAGVANQGQLIPIASPVATSDNSSEGDLKKILKAVSSGGGDNPAAAPSSGGGDSGGGDIMGNVIDAALTFLTWIICTELMLQGKMPRKWWVKGAPVFASYPDWVKQGYYLWAIPCVRHLRSRPDSAFSHVLCVVFNARAKSIAEQPTIQGTLVTVILWPICWLLGAGLALLGKRPDWTSVYGVKN